MGEDQEVVEVGIYVDLDDTDAAKQDANDLAWQHSVNAAHLYGVDIGGEIHGKVYRELSDRYEHTVEHLLFFMQNALVLLKALLDGGHVRLNTENGPWTADEVSERISGMAQMICSSYMYLAAGYEVLWPTNDQMDQPVGLRFTLNKNDIQEDTLEEE